MPFYPKHHPIIVEHDDLFWLVENLNFEVNKYSRQLYGLRGYARGLNGGDDDDDYDLEATLRVQPRKRHYWQ